MEVARGSRRRGDLKHGVVGVAGDVGEGNPLPLLRPLVSQIEVVVGAVGALQVRQQWGRQRPATAERRGGVTAPSALSARARRDNTRSVRGRVRWALGTHKLRARDTQDRESVPCRRQDVHERNGSPPNQTADHQVSIPGDERCAQGGEMATPSVGKPPWPDDICAGGLRPHPGDYSGPC